MPRWTEESKLAHSQNLKGKILSEEQKNLIREGRAKNKKTFIERFYGANRVKDILGNNHVPTCLEINGLEEWFKFYSIENTYDWMVQISRWIQLEAFNFVEMRLRLNEIPRSCEEACILRHGTQKGIEIFNQWRKLKPNLWSKKYWMKKGLSEKDAENKVSEIQISNSKKRVSDPRKSSHRCIEYYIEKGYSEIDAKKIISNKQRRDLDYYITRYGDEGNGRFLESVNKRKHTWTKKDRIAHGLKTIPKSVGNEGGMEQTAIKEFIRQNDLNYYKSMYGSPDKQFTVLIPNVGFRRYDLAIFDDKDNLMIIFEFHGPIHVNFSKYDEVLRYELVWDDRGKPLPYNVTFGEVYDNDIAKRNFIEATYPDALYLVAWMDDYKQKDFTIETLSKRFSDRISKTVL